MNCWLVLGVLVAASATAQNNTSTPPAALPPVPAPAVAPPAAAPAAAPGATPTAPAKKASAKHKHHAAAAPKKVNFSEPTVALVSGPAEVAVSNLNVRGQAGLKGEFIAHVNKGEALTVISEITLDKHKADEPAQWAKIALPASVTVWVDSKFIDATNKTVSVKKLNLRAGPSENYSVLGVLERGAPVTVSGEKNGWSKIEAPTNAYAFVAAMYLKQEASGTVPANPTPSAETQPAPETNNVPTPTAVPEAQPIASEAATNAPEMAQTNATAAPVATAPVPDTNAPAIADTNATATVDTNLPPPPPRIVTHEGFVRHVSSLIEPTAYELYDPKTFTDIDYLYTTSTNLDLARYKNLHIIVTGEEGLAERWPKTPVLTIQRIQVVQ